MIFLGVRNLPESMIMRRWIKKARMLLPSHLVEYAQPNPALLAQTHRHSSLFLAALELVKLGDRNVASFHVAMECIVAGKEKLAEVNEENDGLRLADQVTVNATKDVDDGDLFPLRAPARKRDRGRPTNARDRPAYERCSKHPKFCKRCKNPKHNSANCPDRHPGVKKARAAPKCRGCHLTGHTINHCAAKKNAATVAQVF